MPGPTPPTDPRSENAMYGNVEDESRYDKIEELVAEGLSQREIARRIDADRSVVGRVMSRRGLTINEDHTDAEKALDPTIRQGDA